ncbi:undecaprenyl-diphosphate phosphatase [Paenibacillus turpanensis]|uniref:undecaprenyl-diphosphate phosphatase n=1 Tax=Paenibacillus turpanensis TaxID=2689078 RepID=UPI0014077E30|nr:undecaprenyl-diphosphate phosphatase [Paenibacillus turpanensis]
MFDLWVAFIIGLVEGLTEFLPVSSTGHMILTGHLIHFTGDTAETFEIVIQFAAILAVVVLYWKRVLRLFGIQLGERAPANGPRMNLIHVAIAIVPAMGLAYVLRHFIKDVLFSLETVLIGLVLGGIFMIIAEKQQPPVTAQTMDDLTYRQAFFIGIAQILSLWPGFSRSGSTIAGGMLAGATRAAAADFTFLIAIPIMTAACGYEILQNIDKFSRDSLLFFAVGFVTSFVVALLAVATFIKLVGKLKLTYFAYYRFALAAIILVYMLTVGM